ncbi:pyrroline-5-carboxylate reductase [Methylobacterium sp. WL64]|uniref:pyrroline-5-carboxylate reductase n=1 Tax=Methylobacterium sp. WL64 TaxID=2603894 RepID=UPI0011C87E53|nr:pyrroline-5-carboxylate reductase [Methylobacterium sp. WL64]TXN00406.1 pyrroline-5-carboxylate reductase [Methylobacterium sp. WL64]
MRDFDIALIGCGNMGAALVTGYLNHHPDSRLLVIDPDVTRARGRLPGARRSAFAPAVTPLMDASAALTVVAVKPQSCAALLSELQQTTSANGLILSVAAGVPAAAFNVAMPDARVVRCMPNTPAMVGAGVSVLWCGAEVPEFERALCETLLAPAGIVEWVGEEDLIDAATAISGSGPAYVFAFVQALERAGEHAGLEAGLAKRLALHTVTGAAALLQNGNMDAGDLKASVRSPAGTTDAALKVLENGDALDDLLKRAVDAAHYRAKEMRQFFDRRANP